MTRLTEDDLTGMVDGIEDYDRDLRERTGLTLLGLAARAVGLAEDKAARNISGKKVGVLSLSAGGGVIPGFAHSLAAIAAHLGFEIMAPLPPDALGLAELVAWRAELVLSADDHFFGAYNFINGRVIDNRAATGLGFAVALDAMSGGLAGRDVLIMGCGPVGVSAARACRNMGASLFLYDIKRHKSKAAANLVDGTCLEDDPRRSGIRYDLIIDATPVAEVIDSNFITSETCIAAPGVPLGLTPEALTVLENRVVHDPLQIGTAVMLLMALA